MAHPRVIARREADADARILAAAQRLAKEYDLKAPVEALRASGHRDREVSILQQREAIADLLEGVADAAELGGKPDANLPIPAYNGLKAAEVVKALDGLNAEELDAVAEYEAEHLNRATVLRAIEKAQERNSEVDGPAETPPPAKAPQTAPEAPEAASAPAPAPNSPKQPEKLQP
jgi:hypothetical protein